MKIIWQKDLWGAWCRKCKVMRWYGGLFHYMGWPYCPACKVTDSKNPEWPGTLYEWVPPMKEDGMLRVWDTVKL